MKRQRGVNVSGVNPIINPPKVEDAKGKKKAKIREGDQQNVVNSVVEEDTRRDVSGLGDCVMMMGWSTYEEYNMPWLGDEQMSWGSTWFPWWDMDFMGEAFNALYSDVVWDDDIWNLNNEIPIPLDTKM